jgi:acetyl-CoA carboxylase biotin carboxyl carrier protein
VNQINAEMSASVWKIEMAVGDSVAAGDCIMILESMKMEIPVEAEGPGIIESLSVAEGDAIEAGQLLVEIAESRVG